MTDLYAWLESGKYLPQVMRDFHDQKDIFKSIQYVYKGSGSLTENWVDEHKYTVDCFLWYMASRGYTLQKSRTNVEFREFAKVPAPSLNNLVNPS